MRTSKNMTIVTSGSDAVHFHVTILFRILSTVNVMAEDSPVEESNNAIPMRILVKKKGKGYENICY